MVMTYHRRQLVAAGISPLWQGLLVMSMLVVGCTTLPHEHQAGLSTHTLEQTVSLDGVRSVIIQCNCHARTLKTHADSQVLRLKITGRYHHHSSASTSINNHPLGFSLKEMDGFMTLQSREHAYDTGAYAIEHIEIAVPAKTPVHLLPNKVKKKQHKDNHPHQPTT